MALTDWVSSLSSLDLGVVTDVSVLLLSFLATVFALIQVRNYVLAYMYHLYDGVGSATGLWASRVDVKAVRNPYKSDSYAQRIELQDDGPEQELIYLRIVFDPISVFGLRFSLLRWWVELPDGFRALRRTDVASLSESSDLPDPDETSLTTDAVKVNPNKDAVYDNVAFGYLESKHYVLTSGYLRGEVSYFGTKNNRRIHIPLWVQRPPRSEREQSVTGGDHPRGERDEHRAVVVEVDPPHLPYKNASEIPVTSAADS
jgi:hypothetical protein